MPLSNNRQLTLEQLSFCRIGAVHLLSQPLGREGHGVVPPTELHSWVIPPVKKVG